MISIRNYEEKTDAQAVGILIAETYRKYNLDFASPEEQQKLLGPFRYAGSADPSHQEAIAKVLRAEMVFVAEDGEQIVGVLRCRPGRLQSLFVREDHQHQGVGRKLVERCEHVPAVAPSTSVLHLPSMRFPSMKLSDTRSQQAFAMHGVLEERG